MTSPRPTSDVRGNEGLLELEDSHGELAALVKTYLPDAMTISIVTTSDIDPGQLILHHPDYDKALVARRLRLCADILEQKEIP